MVELSQRNKKETDFLLKDLSKGLPSAESLTLEDSLKRRQVAKVLIQERRMRLEQMVADVNTHYCKHFQS